MTLQEQALRLSHEEIVSVLASNLQLSEDNKTLKTRCKELEEQFQWLRKQIFGQKSERRRYIEPDGKQLFLGEMFEQTPEAVSPKLKTVKEYVRGVYPKKELEGTPEDSGLRFKEGEVPLEVIEIPCPELEGEDRDKYEVVGTKCSYKLAQKPGSYVVIKYERKTVKQIETNTLSTAPAPEPVLGKSYADVSFIAGMMIDKSLYHLPLYRQHQRLRDSGIELSRGTLSSIMLRGISLLEPIYESQFKSILSGKLIRMDEIPVKAGRKERGKMNQSYFWPILGEQNEICFAWRNSREHIHAKELLNDFEGILLTDGYSAYSRYAEKTDNVLHAQCWNHVRRKFVVARELEPDLADRALDYIGLLYAVEAKIRERKLGEDKKLEYRVLHSKPVVEEFFNWLESVFSKQALLPSSPFSEAVNYAFKREVGLKIFLRFPEVPLDTNDIERELRCLAVGRKNWNFCWTELGGKHLGILQSLVRTCLMHKINPWHYLVDVLQRVSIHAQSQVNLLTPRLWKDNFQTQRLKAPLELFSRQII